MRILPQRNKQFSKTETLILETEDFTLKVVISEDSENKKKLAKYKIPTADMEMTMEMGDEIVTNGFITLSLENEGQRLQIDKLSFDSFEAMVALLNKIRHPSPIGY